MGEGVEVDKLPTWAESAKEATPLEVFIRENEPASWEGESVWREGLLEAINWAIENEVKE